jgi:hypothetical protein
MRYLTRDIHGTRTRLTGTRRLHTTDAKPFCGGRPRGTHRCVIGVCMCVSSRAHTARHRFHAPLAAGCGEVWVPQLVVRPSRGVVWVRLSCGVGSGAWGTASTSSRWSAHGDARRGDVAAGMNEPYSSKTSVSTVACSAPPGDDSRSAAYPAAGASSLALAVQAAAILNGPPRAPVRAARSALGSEHSGCSEGGDLVRKAGGCTPRCPPLPKRPEG